jgi:hypothetical protein
MKRKPRYFAHYWRQLTAHQQEQDFPGSRFDHTGGNLFRKRGVEPGDFMYGWSISAGNLYLIGRMQVGRYVSQQVANAHYEEYGCGAWPADDHVFAADGTATTEHFDRTVPLAIIEQLLFVSPKGDKPPKFVTPGRLDQQTLRGVRQLTQESAALLNSIIEDYPK